MVSQGQAHWVPILSLPPSTQAAEISTCFGAYSADATDGMLEGFAWGMSPPWIMQGS